MMGDGGASSKFKNGGTTFATAATSAHFTHERESGTLIPMLPRRARAPSAAGRTSRPASPALENWACACARAPAQLSQPAHQRRVTILSWLPLT